MALATSRYELIVPRQVDVASCGLCEGKEFLRRILPLRSDGARCAGLPIGNDRDRQGKNAITPSEGERSLRPDTRRIRATREYRPTNATGLAHSADPQRVPVGAIQANAVNHRLALAGED